MQCSLQHCIPGSPWHGRVVVKRLGQIHHELLTELVFELVEYWRLILGLSVLSFWQWVIFRRGEIDMAK